MISASFPAPSTPFVGRRRELDLLEQRLALAVGGRGQTVVLSGEPGIGKTRTAERLAGTAERLGARVLWGRCHEWEGAPAYWPWIQIVRAWVRERDPALLRVELGAGAADLAALVPEIHERLGPIPPAPTIDPEQARFRLFDSLTTLLTQAAARDPLALIIDDLHWADSSSLLLLRFLAHEVHSASLFLLLTCRDVDIERPDALGPALAVLARGSDSLRITLDGLDADEVGRFIAITTGQTPPSELVDAVRQESGGNPFFVTELVRLLDNEQPIVKDPVTGRLRVPESVRDVVSQRLERLSPACRATLASASVIGREFDLAVLRQVAEDSGDLTLDMLDEAVRARILDADQARTRYRFNHALIQETIYDRLGTAQRARLHAAIGDALVRMAVRDPTSALPDITHHYWHAAADGSIERARRWAIEAGRHALAVTAYEDAVLHLTRAVQLFDRSGADRADRCEVFLMLGEAQRSAGAIGDALVAFQQAARIAREIDSPDHLARAALGAAGGVMLIGQRDDTAVPLLRDAAEFTKDRDRALHARCVARLALALLDSSVAAPRWIDSQAIVDIARAKGDATTLALALHAQHNILRDMERIDDAAQIASMMTDAAITSGNRELQVVAHIWRGFEPLQIGDMDAFERELEAAERIVNELRKPQDAYVVGNIRVMLRLLSGRLSDATDAADRALEHARRIGIEPRYAHLWWLTLAEVFKREQQALNDLDGALAELQALHTGDKGPFWKTAFRCVQSTILAERGASADAALALRTCVAIIDDWLASGTGMRVNLLYFLSFLAETCYLLNDTSDADTLNRMMVPFHRFNITIGGAFMCRGSVAHFLGLLASTLGRWSEADHYFGEAVSANERMGMLPYVARSRYAWAEALVKRGQRDDLDWAVELARQAQSAAAEMQMRRLEERASALIATIVNQSASPTPAHSLTARELEVLRRIAAGRTDREIADLLYVSPRTISSHVASILNKLGVPSRSAAVAAAFSQGFVLLETEHAGRRKD